MNSSCNTPDSDAPTDCWQRSGGFAEGLQFGPHGLKFCSGALEKRPGAFQYPDSVLACKIGDWSVRFLRINSSIEILQGLELRLGPGLNNIEPVFNFCSVDCGSFTRCRLNINILRLAVKPAGVWVSIA